MRLDRCTAERWTEARLGALSLALGLGDDPWPPIERVRSLYRSIDADVSAQASNLELPCRPGCDACCHEAVFLSAPEFLVVAADLFANKASTALRQILFEMQQVADRFSDELELLDAIESGHERDDVAARVKFRCPLLGPDGRCSVYASRELNARTFGLTWDEHRDHPFGCSLTHERLRVLSDCAPKGNFSGSQLVGARASRRALVASFPATSAKVQVYPWWFRQYAEHFDGA
ncbi:MAG: hypothetical protein IPK13_06410 [Deltaproteobacteria bacterium]|nr:hypothetical protein [Deltaproteobacteria bacterium]